MALKTVTAPSLFPVSYGAANNMLLTKRLTIGLRCQIKAVASGQQLHTSFLLECQKPPEEKKMKSLARIPKGGPKKDIVPSPSVAHIAKHKSRSELAQVPFISKLTETDYSNPQGLVKVPYCKPYESTYVANRPLPPNERVLDQFRLKENRQTKFIKEGLYAYYDIIIIGGGVMGCSSAYWLAQRLYKQLKILVIERDPTYQYASTTLSVGGLRQQFSLPENVEMSLFGADFLRNANKLLYCHDVHTPDVQFHPHGYLFLASEEGAEIMQQNYTVQMDCGARVQLLTPKQLKRKFPWISTDGVALGSYGYENEGWFDPWSLLSALKIKCMELGVHFCHGEVYNFAHTITQEKIYQDTPEDEKEDESTRMKNRLVEAHVHLPDGDVFPFNSSIFVVAAGAESGHIAHLMGIGAGEGSLCVPLPVEPRKRFVYNIHCPDGPGLDCPLVVDPSGTYFRREGLSNHYICGRSPPESEEPSVCDDDVNYDFFDENVWPILARRVRAFESVKVKSAWSGFYDYNSWDQNAIVGNHPYYSNVLFACGFSGHGLQQAPAIGRSVMELILDNGYKTIDLTRFGFDRIMNDVQVKERNIV